jgi:fatty acid desaturase
VPGTVHYVLTLKPLLPEVAFRPAIYKLAIAALHVALVVAGWLAIGHLPLPYWPLAALVIGASLGAIAFLAHDTIHGSVVRNRVVRSVAEIILFSLLLIPRTVYRRVHHRHHRSTNSQHDPDRRFLPNELCGVASAYAKMFFPNRRWRYGPLWFLHIAVYSIRHTFAAFCAKPNLALVTAVPGYTPGERVAIGLEIAIILALQGAVWLIVGGDAYPHRFIAYVFAVPLPIAMMSAVVSFYFFTNHGLKPVGDDADVLAGSTSVAVPRVFNWLHSNFSYHAEHHLFPAMNSDYYPLVSALIREHFGEHYHRLTIGSAWTALLGSDVAATHREQANSRSAASAA